MDKLKYQIKTSIFNDVIKQELFLISNIYKEKVSTWVIETQEKGFRDALIELGWTPPRGKGGGKR